MLLLILSNLKLEELVRLTQKRRITDGSAWHKCVFIKLTSDVTFTSTSYRDTLAVRFQKMIISLLVYFEIFTLL